jgi:preflagellin peptidase FlaK
MALSGTDAANYIDVVRVFVAIVALGMASLTDLRTRKVPNTVWYVTAGVGLALLAVDLWELEGGNPWHMALLVPMAAFFMVVITGGELWPVMPPDEEDEDRELTPSEAKVYIADLAVSGVLIAVGVAVLLLAPGRLEDDGPVWYIVSSVVMILLALAFYLTRLLHGGGDAKALMTLAVLFPIYPLGDPLPLMDMPAGMELLFPFSLTVLIDAAIIAALTPLAFITMSAVRGPLRFPEAVFGYPVPMDAFDGTRMWLLYELKEGAEEPRRRLWPRRSKAADEDRARALELLRDRGEDRIYVSPKLPFMVPMLIGLVIAIIVGNLVMGAVWGILGS